MAEFWENSRVTLQKKDITEIAELTQFPIDVDLAHMEEFKDLGTRDGFTSHDGALFPESTALGAFEIPVGPGLRFDGATFW
jgi:hypothetical protein